jgi:hypothetical protein
VRPERCGALQEPGDRLSRIAKTLDVGEVATGLEGHDEAGGEGLGPRHEGLSRWETVEGVVDLDGGEGPDVVVQPSPYRQVVGIEDTPPVPVLPARCPDVEHLFDLSL